MKIAVFWDVAPCHSCVNRHFGETYRLHLQCRKICEREHEAAVSSALETSVHTRTTRRRIPENGILHICPKFDSELHVELYWTYMNEY
jgi:hypothetical protein